MKQTNKPRTSMKYGLLLASIMFMNIANAEENLWVYTQGTDTRPKGSVEVKLSDVIRMDKDSGDYTFHEIRPEFEYGITDRLTIGLEALVFRHDYSDVEWGPMVDTQGGEGGSFKNTGIGGVEVSLKYNVLSPYKDAIGLSVGGAWEYRSLYRLDGADIDQHSIVPTIWLQKNWLDDTLVLASKNKMEFERRKGPGVLEEEIAFDLSLGLSYRVAPKWFVGVETRYQSDFLSPEEKGLDENGNYFKEIAGKPSSWDLGDFAIGDQFQYGLYLGPTVHYAEQNWWATAGLLFQVKGWGADGEEHSRDGYNWDEHERYHLGLFFGYEY